MSSSYSLLTYSRSVACCSEGPCSHPHSACVEHLRGQAAQPPGEAPRPAVCAAWLDSVDWRPGLEPSVWTRCQVLTPQLVAQAHRPHSTFAGSPDRTLSPS